MRKDPLIRMKKSGFVNDCLLFRSNVSSYWLLGVVGWCTLLIFIYITINYVWNEGIINHLNK